MSLNHLQASYQKILLKGESLEDNWAFFLTSEREKLYVLRNLRRLACGELSTVE
jgi:hypothetical protein